MVAWPYPLSACCLLPVPSGTTAPDRELSPQAAPCLYLCRSEEKDGPPRFLGNPCMDMPCSSTPAALPCQAIRQGRVAFQHLKTVGDCHYHNFGALSHGLPTRCVRFAAAVTRHHATLAAGWWLALAGWDFHPLGFTTSFPPSRFPGCPGFAWRTQTWWMAVRRQSCLTDRLPALHPETGRCSRPVPAC